MKNKRYKKTTIMVTSEDDFCPSFENDKVELNLSERCPHTGSNFVSVWGADDLGMDIEIKDLTKARELFRKLKKSTISFQMLYDLGFETC
jgi:hypothetical protein